MSLILEALRKSEAERRRAQAPDLFAPVQVAPVPERRLPPAWIAGGLAALLLAVALLALRGQWLRAPEPPAVAASGTAPAARAAAAVAIDPPRRLPALPASADPVDAPEAPPPALVAAADPGAGETAPRVEAKPPAAPSRPRSGDMPGVDAAPVKPAVPSSPVAENGPGTFDGTSPLRLAELAPASRRELPPLKLTMHMWNEAAAQRFVIVDGRRLVEGDRLGAVQVAEIRRDGVLLDWNGRPLLLPLR